MVGQVPGGDGGVLTPATDRSGAASGHDRTKIAQELYSLARNGATGAMMITGNSPGTIFLEGGRVTFAESSGIPDLPARLAGSGRLPEAQWPPRESPHGDPGALLVERGVLSEEELRAVVHSAVLDAVTALATAPVADIRFTPLERHWAGRLLALETGEVLAEADRRAALPAVRRVSPQARPKLCELLRPWATIRREHWPLIWRVDGVATVRELAWRSGLALHDAVEGVDALVRAGLCVLLPPAPRRDEPGTAGKTTRAPEPAAAADPGEPAATSPLPQRVRGASMRDEPPPEAFPGLPRPARDDRTVYAAAHPDVLRRVLDGLKRLGR